MDEAKFTIETTMEKEDYRKFLYFATFCRNKLVLPMIAGIALAGSLLFNFDSYGMNWGAVLAYWALFFVIAVGTICFQVERKNKVRIKTDQTGAFGSRSVIRFYEYKLVIKNDALKSTGELQYDQCYAVLENKDYFIFYLTANQASLIRKKDLSEMQPFKQFLADTFGKRFKCA